MEGASNSGTELPESTDSFGQFVLDFRKMMEVVVINTFHRLVLPIVEDLIRKVVNEEIQSALMTSGNGNRTREASISTENRTLQLKFLDEVSLPVLTGKEIEGKEGTAMRLGIINDTTGQLVTSGPEASAKVEILLLQADDNDNEHNWSTEDFYNKIIRECDKEKPHVAKGMYVRLKEGVAILSNVKLGHGSSWKKRCSCRLGARFVDNSNGSRVKEAWTESFMVEDRRGKLYGKHYPPSLLDEVWRLENIGRDGVPCKDLYREKIFTVRDFRFLLSIDPQRLRRIFKGSRVWKAIVDHARTCIIDDEKIYLYSSPSKFNFVVAFDAVARLMGIVRDSHFVQLDNLSEDEQASARELLLHAFENKKDITYVDDENSLVQQFPYESRDICVATDSLRNDEYAPIEPDTSSLAVGLSTCPSNNFSLIDSEKMQQICDPSLPVPDRGPSSSTSALGDNRALRDPSLTIPHRGPCSVPIPLSFNQALCDPSLAVPDQGPNSALIPLGSNKDPSLIVPYQGPSSQIPLGSNQRFCDPSLGVPYQDPSYSLIPRGSCQASCDQSVTLPDQGPMYPLNDLGSNQPLCYPSFIVPDQGPIYSLTALDSCQASCHPFSTLSDQGPSSSLIPLGSNQVLSDPSLIVPYQGPSSQIPLGSNQRFRDPSLGVPYQGPSYSLIPRGSCQASCDPSVTLPDQGPIYALNDLCSNQALCYPSFTFPDQGPIYSLIAPGSYQSSCNPFSTVCDQGPSSSLFVLGSKHALCDASLCLPDLGQSSSAIALGSNQASSDPSLTVPEQASSDRSTDLNDLFGRSGDNELISLYYYHNNNHSKTYGKSRSIQQSNAGSIRFFAAVGLTMWVSRVRKRVMGFCDFDVQKRLRIG